MLFRSINTFYIPRTTNGVDVLFGEAPNSSFENAILIEMYLKNYAGFGGDGDMMSKFGISMADQLTLCVSRRRFQEEIGGPYNLIRPNEGDLIYFSVPNAIFEIKFVEHEAIFYQLGALQTFDMTCELFEYNNEILNTGIPLVDEKQKDITFNMTDFAIKVESGLVLTDEEGFDLVLESFSIKTQDPISDNISLQSEGDEILDFSEIDPFSEGVY